MCARSAQLVRSLTVSQEVPGSELNFGRPFSVRGQGSKPLVWSLYVLSGAGDLKEPTHLLIEVCLSAGVVVADKGH